MKSIVKTVICTVKTDGDYSHLFDYEDIVHYADHIEGVLKVLDISKLPVKSPLQLSEILRETGADRIVIAGIHPGMHKGIFANAMLRIGKKAEDVILADFTEYAILNGKSTEMAKAVLLCAVKGIEPSSVLIPNEYEIMPDTLVIGGGIAGIQASLEIANGGQKVYLLERTGTIGGHMAMFDKTFPTLDCAACILTPKMVEVGQHPNIEIITYSDVRKVEGSPGNYTVTIHKKARRVDINTCIGCGTCAEKCPRTAPSEFDSKTTLRKAIYISFPQAVPNKYLIDADHCTYVENGKCGVCVKVCPVPDCINLDEKDTEIKIKVGSIIVATGFKVFDASRATQFGYGKYPNVLTSLEFERIINASGPTDGNITFRTQDKKGNWIFTKDSGEPESIAIIHCVGSRDEHFNKYCSKVCCMYSLKLAHLVKEKIHHADVYEYFIDMRAFGKGYEEFYERIKGEGVHIIRGRTAKIEQKGNKLILRSEDILNEKIIEQEVDMVILSVGLEPTEDSKNLASLLGLQTDNSGWFNEANYTIDQVNTYTGGISIAGLCQGPKDIPDTVAQASAAAARVLQRIIRGSVKGSIKDLSLRFVEEKIKALM